MSSDELAAIIYLHTGQNDSGRPSGGLPESFMIARQCL